MPSPSDLAFRVLRLEQQLESYQRLHNEELAELRRTLEQLAAEVLVLAASREAVSSTIPAPQPETVEAPARAVASGSMGAETRPE